MWRVQNHQDFASYPEDDHGEELRRAEEEEAQNEECHTCSV